MSELVEPERTPLDYLQIGLVWLGILIGAAGVITASWVAAIFGAVLVLWCFANFVVQVRENNPDP
jgi:hypothetical protein